MADGRPRACRIFRAMSAISRVVPGCPVLALAITGLPAAIAAAKSPPEAELKANGKLLGPNTTTGASNGPRIDRIFDPVSIVARRHEPSRAAAAACLN